MHPSVRRLEVIQHRDARGWLCEVWRQDRLQELDDAQMHLLCLLPGESRGLHCWPQHAVSLSLCGGEVDVVTMAEPGAVANVVALFAPQAVLLLAGCWWGLRARSEAQLLCALPDAAPLQAEWTAER
jgi:dTDP-4-dehydrorhamnose 3,5-epimerase-like enzyme